MHDRVNPLVLVFAVFFCGIEPASAQPIRSIGVGATRLLASPSGDRLYAVLRADAGAPADAVAVIDPVAGAVMERIPVGRAPTELAITREGTRLWVAVEDGRQARAVDLPSGELHPPFELIPGAWVVELEALPGDRDSLLVSFRGPTTDIGDVALFVGGVQRGASLPEVGRQLAVMDEPGVAYASSGQLTRLRIDSVGVHLDEARQGFSDGFNGNIVHDSGLLFNRRGQVIDPARWVQVDRFAGEEFEFTDDVQPDVERDRVFYFRRARNSEPASIRMVSATTGRLRGEFLLPVGLATQPEHPVVWGSGQGLAWVSFGEVHLLRTDDIQAAVPAPRTVEQIAPHLQRLPYWLRDAVYDARGNKIYGSRPSAGRPVGNTVAIFDAATLELEAEIDMRTEPGPLALSDSGRYLYVGMAGANLVHRIDLDRREIDWTWRTSDQLRSFFPSISFAVDVAVQPGRDETLAIAEAEVPHALGNRILGPTRTGNRIVDRGESRPNIVSDGAGSIAFNGAGDTLWGLQLDSAGLPFLGMPVDAAGIQAGGVVGGLFPFLSPSPDYQLVNDRIYAASGTVFDTVESRLLGALPIEASAVAALPDQGLVCYFRTDNFVYYFNLEVRCFDTETQRLSSQAAFENLPVIPHVTGALSLPNNRVLLLTRGLEQLVLDLAGLEPVGSGPDRLERQQVTDGVWRFDGAFADLAWEASSKRLAATVSGADGQLGNTLTLIDVDTGGLRVSAPVGSEPSLLELGDDGQTGWVYLSGEGRVRKVDLKTMQPGIFVDTGLVLDMDAAPGQPEILAVANGTVSVFDDGAPRAHAGNNQRPVTGVEFGVTADVLFGHNGANSSFELYRMRLEPQGPVVVSETRALLAGFNLDFTHTGGLLYSAQGQVLNPWTASESGRLPGDDRFYLDEASSRIYFFGAPSVAGKRRPRLEVWDRLQYRMLGSIELPGLEDGVARIRRAGDARVALLDYQGRIWVIDESTLELTPFGRNRRDAALAPARVRGSPRGFSRAEAVAGGDFVFTPLPERDTFPFTVREIVYDSTRRRLYAALGGEGGSDANAILVLDPVSHQVEAAHGVPGEPTLLEVSPDGETLYVGFQGVTEVARFRLPGFQPLSSMALGEFRGRRRLHARSIAVSADGRHAAVSRRDEQTDDDGGTVLFQSGRLLAAAVVSRYDRPIGAQIAQVAFSADGSQVYGLGHFSVRARVEADGLYLMDEPRLQVQMPSNSLADVAADTAYFPQGVAADLALGRKVGDYPFAPEGPLPGSLSAGRGEYVAADTSQNRIYFAGNDLAIDNRIYAFELSSGRLLGAVQRPVEWGEPERELVVAGGQLAYRTLSGIVWLNLSAFPSEPAATPREWPQGSVRTLDLPARGLTWDAGRRRLLATLLGRAGDLGNSIVFIDPTAGKIERSAPVEHSPGKVAVTSDGAFAFVGHPELGIVSRVRLEDGTVDGVLRPSAPWTKLEDFEVHPNARRVVAVDDRMGLTVFDEAGAIASEEDLIGTRQVEFGGDGALFAMTSIPGHPPLRRYRIAEGALVDEGSLNGVDPFPNLPGFDVRYAEGRLYNSVGDVFDAETGQFAGRLEHPLFDDRGLRGAALAPEPDAGRLWVAIEDSRDGFFWIHSFDLQSLEWREGAAITPANGGHPLALVRHDTGFAILTSDDRLILTDDSRVNGR